MLITRLTIRESNHISRLCEPVTTGIPIAQGLLLDTTGLALFTEAKQLIPIQSKMMARWADNSIRWLLIDFQISLEASETSVLDLVKLHPDQLPEVESPIIVNRNDSINVMTAENIFTIDITGPALLINIPKTAEHSGFGTKILPVLTDRAGTAYQAEIDTVVLPETQQPVRTTIILKGHFEIDQRPLDLIAFEAQLNFFTASSRVKIDFTLINQDAASHPGGLWDLGDPGSFIFKSCELSITHPPCLDVCWQSDANQLLNHADTNSISIYQESSGGDQWKSATHKNSDGLVPFKLKGYQCTSDNNLIETGLRASPIIYSQFPSQRYGAYIEGFWQNFPTAITTNKQSLNLKLFPDTHPDLYELQGGEQKTHTCHIDFNTTGHGLEWLRHPLNVTLAPDYYIKCQAFPYLTDNLQGLCSPYIQAGLTGPDSFYQKRETIDEYGWRHFGELYADHECWNHKGNDHLVSHYNNQYDPIYGFARQYILSGDHGWFDLMDDLSKHVTDIDIYHTELDKSEYNGGLFWHTNHYLDAHTCTHRTFSKHHPNLTADGPSGGGPANEHCYTTGLLYHYFLTGSEGSKKSLLSLIDWAIRIHQRPDTLLGKLNVLASKGIPLLKRVVKGEAIPNRTYAFTRGTGNYVNTLADAYHLTSDSKYLESIDSILRKTFHPKDDIQARHLEDVENTWSYTVFLQAVSKYIDIKIEHNEFDNAFHFARDGFLHYSQWMLEHETTFLSKPEKLDYANHTWVAQEIRKANLLCLAYKYCGGTNKEYLKRAQYFYNYIAEELKGHPESSYTRIRVILMQNHGVAEYFQEDHDFNFLKNLPSVEHATQTTISLKFLINLFCNEAWHGLRRFSLAKEIAWLRLRFK